MIIINALTSIFLVSNSGCTNGISEPACEHINKQNISICNDCTGKPFTYSHLS